MRVRLCRDVGFLIVLAILVGVSRVGAQLSPFQPHIVNGVLTADYPTTGALLFGNSAGSAQGLCSGTLIGCQTFLTAGHCVCDTTGAQCQGAGAPNPAQYFVFLQHGGIYSVSNIALRSDFNFPVGDVAVLRLAAPVTGISPTAINTTAAPSPGTLATIAGFGDTGGPVDDYGLKYFGDVHMASCTGGVSNTTSVCFNFSNPLGAPGSNSDTCNGDSGGPLFVDFGSGPRLSGVTSGGNSANCLPTDASYDANVFNYRSWIQSQAGADLSNTTCGNIPQVGGPKTNVFATSGQLNSATPSAVTSFDIPPGTQLLRVTLNSTSDLDMYVRAGSPASVSNFDCRQDGSSPFGACEFNAPVAGTWYVLVQKFSSSGRYQVTATRFGGGCANPADNGKPCDDGDACTVNDVCNSGVCGGSPATGTSCDDGDPCTQADTCQAGTCRGTVRLRNGCQQSFVPGNGFFRLLEPSKGDDKLSWRWLRGTATSIDAFGDPVHTTDYGLCVYDTSRGAPTVLFDKRIPAGGVCGGRACWKAAKTSVRYTDRAATAGGINSIFLKAGTDGRAQILVTGTGAGLNPPTLPLDPNTDMTVQLGNDTACWESHFSTNVKNTAIEFRAKSD